MAFEKKTWKARKTEYPNRRMLTLEDGSTELVTVAREEGIISEEGDAFSPENMNGLEERIANEFTDIGNEVGKTDISGMGDGTVKGAIHQLNTDIKKKPSIEDVNNMLSGFMKKGLFNLGSSCSRLDTNCEQVNGCWCYVITLGLWDESGFAQGVRLAISYQRDMPKQWVAAYMNHELSRPWTEI